MLIMKSPSNPLPGSRLSGGQWLTALVVMLLFASVAHAQQWIGAITEEDAHIPAGRQWTGGVENTPEAVALWDAADSLSRRSILLRKEFRLNGDVKKAHVTVAAPGFCELTVNGQRVGDNQTYPLQSEFDKTVWTNTYDIAPLLHRGKNVVGVMLGNGFYNIQAGRYAKVRQSYGPPTLWLKMTAETTSGRKVKVVSDKTWRWSESPVTFNCVYGGEDYDARLEQPGWDRPGFNAKEWHAVVKQHGPKGTLREQMAPPAKIMERYAVQDAHRLDSHTIVLDMGQNLAGFPEVTVSGEAGQTVTMYPAERLYDNGTINQSQSGAPHYYAYTLKGTGLESWHPRFTWYGFRYIQLSDAVLEGEPNPEGLPVVTKIQSCFLYDAAPTIGDFACSNELFNATHRLIDRAMRSNMQGVLTDCPHREKLGWLEQTHLNGPGLYYNYDLRGYMKQVMQNIADAQHENGGIPSTAPEYATFGGEDNPFVHSPEWGCAVVFIPFQYRDFYGDASLIKDYYDVMVRYADYLGTREEEGLLRFGLGDWCDYGGDHQYGGSHHTPVPVVASAHYYMVLTYMTEAAQLMGRKDDAARFQAKSEAVKEAFQKEFFHGVTTDSRGRQTASYSTGSQCANALPLFAGMVPDSCHEAVLNALVDDVRAHGNRLTTGDVGNRYLFQALARDGQDQVVCDLVNHDGVPGYGYQLKFGATSLTELWDPNDGASWNHFMMGQIEEWFYASLAGIRPQPNGKVIIDPRPVDGVDWVKAKWGEFEVEWHRDQTGIDLKVKGPKERIIYGDGLKRDKGSRAARNQPIQFFAHRGSRMEFDENTMEAFRATYEAGIRGYETDIRMTGDGDLILSHDESLKRTCGIDKQTEDLTTKECKAIRTLQGHKLVMAKELARYLKDKDGMYVEWEIKTIPELYDEERLEVLCKKLWKTVMPGKPKHSEYLFTSFDKRALRIMKKQHPEAILMMLESKPCSKAIIDEALSMGIDRVGCKMKGTTREVVEYGHEKGVIVSLWPGTSIDDFQMGYELDCDAMCCDKALEVGNWVLDNLPKGTIKGYIRNK